MEMRDIIITFESPRGHGILLLALMSISSVGSTLSLSKGVPAVIFPGMKPQESEANNSPPSSAEVKYGRVVPPFHE
jgi:hypothetical protein